MRRLMLAGLVAVSVAAVVYVVAPSGSDRPHANPADARQVAQGRDAYERLCASCHGKDLEGQPNWREHLPTGGLPAPPHDESGHTWHHPDAVLFRITKLGGAAAAPAGFKSNMPAFSGLLSDDEIWAILAYIKSRWPVAVQARQAEITRRSRAP